MVSSKTIRATLSHSSSHIRSFIHLLDSHIIFLQNLRTTKQCQLDIRGMSSLSMVSIQLAIQCHLHARQRKWVKYFFYWPIDVLSSFLCFTTLASYIGMCAISRWTPPRACLSINDVLPPRQCHERMGSDHHIPYWWRIGREWFDRKMGSQPQPSSMQNREKNKHKTERIKPGRMVHEIFTWKTPNRVKNHVCP